ncbi:MAG: hypothetical protein H6807_00540 [Planctomycetes bacterium]|nr:hypothetical protein [Planctomycetota bacterium]
MPVTVNRLLPAVLVLLCVTSLRAQTPIDLRLNGQHDAAAPIGSMLDISASTTPNVWGSIIFSANPGPTLVFGTYLIPIGFDASTIVSHPFFYTGPSGVFTDSVPLLNDLYWEGITYYAYAYTYDATDVTGFGSSNQARVTFTRHVEAGADTAGFVNQPVTLDGSGVASQGPVPGNLAASWTIVSGPTGHAATLDGADTLFPTLTADLPGTYDVELDLSFPSTTGGATDLVSIQVYDLAAGPQGSFSTADPVAYAATLTGPAGASLSVDGGTATTSGSLAGSKPAAAIATGFDYAVQAANGQKLGRARSVINNVGGSLAVNAANSLVAHLEQPILDEIELAMETVLATIDPSSAIGSLPPITLVNTTFFTATATVQSITFDPNIDVELSFVPGAMHVQMTLTNVVIVFNINGTIVFAPYSDVGTLTLGSVTIDFDLVPTVSGGMFASTTANESATVANASLTFQGNIIPSSQIPTILGILIPTVESTLATTVPPLVPPIVDGTLNSIPQSVDLSAQGLDVNLAFVPSGLAITTGRMDLIYDAGAAANNVVPGTANLLGYYATPSMIPTYNGVVPGTATPYKVAAGLADDFLNQLVAAALQAGALELDLGGSFDLNGMTLNADAGSFDQAFPGLGFDKFDVLAPVTLTLHPTIAPIVTIDANGGSNYGIELADVLVDVRVEAAPGHIVSVLRLSADASTSLGITVNTMTSTIDLTPGAATASIQGVSSLPGIDLGPSLATLGGLINSALPGLLSPITGIPIPSIAGTTYVPVVVGIAADGPSGDFLSIFLD